MIEAKNIHKHYGNSHILKGVNLVVDKGELLAIVGSSGAGKTTLLQLLSTLDMPDKNTEFELEVDGHHVFKLNQRQLAKFRNEQIGFIFQFHNLIPEFTALENVMLPALIKTKNKKISKEKAIGLLNYLGIESKADEKPNMLSGGEQQRVAIARALINNPSVIFADEPTGNLDQENSQRLYELFSKLRKDFEQTLVIVTHDLSLAEKMDRFLTLEKGLLIPSS